MDFLIVIAKEVDDEEVFDVLERLGCDSADVIKEAPRWTENTTSMEVIQVADRWKLDPDDSTPKSDMEKLRDRIDELEWQAEGYDELMDAITEMTGTDPRKVEAEKPSSANPFAMPQRASNTNIAINLLTEAIRKGNGK